MPVETFKMTLRAAGYAATLLIVVGAPGLTAVAVPAPSLTPALAPEQAKPSTKVKPPLTQARPPLAKAKSPLVKVKPPTRVSPPVATPIPATTALVRPTIFPPIPFMEFRLHNGLRVILHEDHSTPIVAVNIWYHVGSKNEVPGRTGFAHLFEHLMFQGSKHYNDDYFKPLQEVGATINGTTNPDRTNFYEVVPSNFLELALSMEADRMGYLLDALTEERLNNQREVVKNEKRQNYDNKPYGLAYARIVETLYPPDHPYHWLTIGSLEDLSAASLDDVKAFFSTFYVPSNATLVISGDFVPAEARRYVEKHFGPLPTGLPVRPVTAPAPKLERETRLTMEDRVAVPRLYMVWPTVPFWSADEAPLDMLANGLAQSKMARLYKTLVYDRQIAQDVTASHDTREIAGHFVIAATARSGKSLKEIEEVIDREIASLKVMPPSTAELERDYNAWEARFVYDMQTVHAKADQLNRYATFLNRPGYFQDDLTRYRRVSSADIQRVIGKYLTNKRIVLNVVPVGGAKTDGGKTDKGVQQATNPAEASVAPVAANIPPTSVVSTAAPSGTTTTIKAVKSENITSTNNKTVDAQAVGAKATVAEATTIASAEKTPSGDKAVAHEGYERPRPQPDPPFSLPRIQHRQLSNGLEVIIVEQHELPVANFKLVIKAGAAADPPERAGLAAFTADLLDEGTETRSALSIASEFSGIGAVLSTEVGWDLTSVSLLTLTRHLDRALKVYASIIADPTFPQGELERLRASRLLSLQQRRDSPTETASAIYASLLYGGNHPYGHVPGGREAAVNVMQQEDVQRFYEAYYRPNNAALIVVGDVQPDTLLPRLERAFFGWKKSAQMQPVIIPPAPARDQAAIYLVDKPGAAQSVIMLGQVGAARSTPDYFPLLVLNNLLGGQFSSRVNLNLREAKGYTYSARTSFSYRRSAGPFAATAGVQTAVTKEAVREFLRELHGVRGELPIQAQELEFARQSLIRGFPRSFETPTQIADRLTDIVVYDLPDDYFDSYLANVRAVTLEDVQRVANRYIDPSRMTILIVGDRKTIEPELRTLDNLGTTLTLLDAEGHRTTQ